MNRRRSYAEMIQWATFEERYEYLRLQSNVGEATFGFDRYINQQFYRSTEWRRTRDIVIVRDQGLDLSSYGHEIFSKIIIHHMNPITLEQLDEHDPDVLDPEYLISTTHDTHNAIHYGDERLLAKPYVERRPGDTLLWRR